MSTTLLLTVTGLALLDSLNPATILGVALILVVPNGHPVRAALAYVLGAYLTVLGLGLGLYLAADAAAGVLDGGLTWVRSIEPTAEADIVHRRHAIIETVFADLIDGPLAHLPFGHFGANSAWALCAAIAHNLLYTDDPSPADPTPTPAARL
jgi:hypothetical protein